MKLNELVCPSCGLKCLVDAAYTNCDGCGTHFTAAQSRSRDNPAPLGIQITIDPNVTAPIIHPTVTPWVVPPNYPTTGTAITGTQSDGVTYEVWN